MLATKAYRAKLFLALSLPCFALLSCGRGGAEGESGTGRETATAHVEPGAQPLFQMAILGVNVADPAMGPAKIEGDDGDYFHLGLKLRTDKKLTLVFRQHDCILSGRDASEYTECWIHVAGVSGRVSIVQGAPLSLKSLNVILPSGDAEPPVPTFGGNASRVNGPDGFVKFDIPPGGGVDLNFIWPVPPAFKPGRIVIKDVIEIDIGRAG